MRALLTLTVAFSLFACACAQSPKNSPAKDPLHVDLPEYSFINYDGNNLRYDTASPSMKAFFIRMACSLHPK